MARSSEEADTRRPRDMLISLPKFSPGPEAEFVGWSLQVESLLKLSGATNEVKLASVLDAIPANILTKVFVEKSSLCLPNDYNYLSILEKVRVFYAQNPDEEKDCYNVSNPC